MPVLIAGLHCLAFVCDSYGQNPALDEMRSRAQEIQNRQQEEMRKSVEEQRSRWEAIYWFHIHRYPFRNVGGGDLGLPPAAPALGDPLPFENLKDWPAASHSRWAAAIGEHFYIPFGNLLARTALSPKRLRRIDSYFASARQHTHALQSEVERLKDTPAAERSALLQAFSKTQAHSLAQLADEAEAIRSDLTANTAFRATDDGREIRETINRLPAKSDQHTYLLALEAEHFHAGLSPAHRELLRMIAIEHEISSREGSNLSKGQMFFWPPAARITVPAGASAELTADLALFATLRDRLKDELWTLVSSEDFFSLAARTRRYEELAARQVPQIAELEALAEKIRPQLVGLQVPLEPRRPEQPIELIERAGVVLERKFAFERRLTETATNIQSEFPAIKVEADPGSGLIIAGDAKPPKKLQSALDAVNRQLAEEQEQLAAELVLLNSELRRDAAQEDRNLEAFASELHHVYVTEQVWRRYEDYRTAVLEPGLSPEQRSLLYRIALADLARASLDTSNDPSLPSR